MIDFSQFDSFFSMADYFSDDEICKRTIIECRWGSGESQDVVCPYCGKHLCRMSKSGRFHCTGCNKNFS
ncbi:MAG: transposase, partial [Bacteroidales bacterium]|nr:transposase [Candidatus Colimorpha onthohippi]